MLTPLALGAIQQHIEILNTRVGRAQSMKSRWVLERQWAQQNVDGAEKEISETQATIKELELLINQR